VGAHAPESGSGRKNEHEKINRFILCGLRLKNGCICSGKQMIFDNPDLTGCICSGKSAAEPFFRDFRLADFYILLLLLVDI